MTCPAPESTASTRTVRCRRRWYASTSASLRIRSCASTRAQTRLHEMQDEDRDGRQDGHDGRHRRRQIARELRADLVAHHVGALFLRVQQQLELGEIEGNVHEELVRLPIRLQLTA